MGSSGASLAVSTSSSPYTALLPPLSEAEFRDLKADIAVRGVLVALEYLPDGTLLDGAHRRRAAEELGCPYPRVIRAGLDTHEKAVAHVLALHAHRRMLSPSARRELIARLRTDGLSVRAIAAATGTPRSTVARTLASGVPGETPGDVETVQGLDGKRYPRRRRPRPGPTGITVGSPSEQNRAAAALTSLAGDAPTGRAITLQRAERLAREHRLATGRVHVNDAHMPATLDLRLGSFREVLSDIPDASVDLVLTDPPWTAAAIREGVFADVAAMSARILRPGGHLAIYSGTQHLPDVIAQLHSVKELEYRWTIAITNGDQTAASARLPRVSSRWRAVILYRKPGGEKADWLPTDWVQGGGRERELHKWGQGVQEAVDIVNMLTVAGDHICDPFAGSATSAVAAFQTGRSWTGCDIDGMAFETARARLARLDGEAGTSGLLVSSRNNGSLTPG